MSYTREQAEEIMKDYNEYIGLPKELIRSDTQFLNHKFGQQLEVGKWYRHKTHGSTLCYKGNGVGFGTWLRVWCNGLSVISNKWQPMTDEEVHDFLKSECEKRYKVGDVVKSVMGEYIWTVIDSFGCTVGSECVFLNGIPVLDPTTGEWAEVIKKDPIAEQIEKLEKELETLKSKYNEQNK